MCACVCMRAFCGIVAVLISPPKLNCVVEIARSKKKKERKKLLGVMYCYRQARTHTHTSAICRAIADTVPKCRKSFQLINDQQTTILRFNALDYSGVWAAACTRAHMCNRKAPGCNREAGSHSVRWCNNTGGWLIPDIRGLLPPPPPV